MSSYLRILRTPGVRLPLLAGLLGAVLIGMMPLAVLLSVEQHTGSFATAGLTVGVLTAGNAAGVVAQGIAIDRLGPRPVLLVTGSACCTSLVLLVAGGPGLVLAGIAGATLPATPSSLRAAWPRLIPDKSLRASAYALHAVVFTLGGVTGPLLATTIPAPTAAVVIAATFALASATLFTTTPTARRRVTIPNHYGTDRHSGMRMLVVTNAGAGVGLGVVTVAVPAALSAHHRLGLAGLAFAVNATADLAGGLLYGARRWRTGPRHRLAIAFVAVAAGLGCLAATTGSPAGLVVAMAAAGLVAPLVGITSSALLDDVAEPGTLTGSYALLVAAGLTGAAAGTVLAARLTTRPWLALLLAATLVAAQALVVRLSRATRAAPGPSSDGRHVDDAE